MTTRRRGTGESEIPAVVSTGYPVANQTLGIAPLSPETRITLLKHALLRISRITSIGEMDIFNIKS
jgi:hypothetical protein